jgi:hypothetical protein
VPAYYRETVSRFLDQTSSEIIGLLTTAYSRDSFQELRTDAVEAWNEELPCLAEALKQLSDVRPEVLTWSILIEFNIPRIRRRIDAVVVGKGEIAVIEFKTHDLDSSDIEQLEDYALDLHYFHKPSAELKIWPIAVTVRGLVPARLKRSRQISMFGPRRLIMPTTLTTSCELGGALKQLDLTDAGALKAEVWDQGEYFPVPSIIDAALGLAGGLRTTDIAFAEAAQHDIRELVSYVLELVRHAQSTNTKTICFLTGVPGSGKTLVGLSLAFDSNNTGEERPSMHFMSGNGPLVRVLQTALARQHRSQRKVRAKEAERFARTLIQNIHFFAREYYQSDSAVAPKSPYDRVIIFDEAQRAWDRAQNKKKFDRDVSEPEMVLSIMERVEWAVVIALVGGGQEINDGEAGLAAWGEALNRTAAGWNIYASPEALKGGASVAGGRLYEENGVPDAVVEDHRLHLKVSVRSLRAERLAEWVNSVLDGNADDAKEIAKEIEFPMLLTRSLGQAKAAMRDGAVGSARYGLVGSSGAARLRAQGLEASSAFHFRYPWEEWFLTPKGDLRSSFQTEVFATEFEIQGLELDWVCLCWDGDFIWVPEEERWVARNLSLSKSKWNLINSSEKKRFRRNAYRVLLTRARQGLIVYVPEGSADDPTRTSAELDAVAAMLLRCGMVEI